MSEFDADAADRLDEDPILDDPDLDEPTGDELDDPELAAAEAEAEQVDLDSTIDDEPDDIPIEPGAEGPEGTGIEGADDALVDEAGWEDENEAPGPPTNSIPISRPPPNRGTASATRWSPTTMTNSKSLNSMGTTSTSTPLPMTEPKKSRSSTECPMSSTTPIRRTELHPLRSGQAPMC